MSEPAVITTITDQLTAGSHGLLKLSPEVSDPSGKWTMFNDSGVEAETGEFLYGFVRALKPEFVVETGTSLGVGACYLAAALEANGSGALDTIELDHGNHLRARQLFSHFSFAGRINAIHGSSLDYIPPRAISFALLDTEPQIRFEELRRLLGFLAPGAWVAIHDLPQHMGQQNWVGHEKDPEFWPWFRVPAVIRQAVQDDILRVSHMATPRGLTLFYVPPSGTYRWDSGEIS